MSFPFSTLYIALDLSCALTHSLHCNRVIKCRGREWTANVLLGLGAILWSVPVASIQALATADQIATVPGLSWINTLNGGEVAAFVSEY